MSFKNVQFLRSIPVSNIDRMIPESSAAALPRSAGGGGGAESSVTGARKSLPPLYSYSNISAAKCFRLSSARHVFAEIYKRRRNTNRSLSERLPGCLQTESKLLESRYSGT